MGFFRSENILGLDIGFETLKLVELKKNGKNVSLIGSAETPLTEKIMEKDRFKNKAAVATMIKEACRKAMPGAISAKKVVTALPETFVFSKTVKMPKMTREEYSKAIIAEAAQYLPIPVEEVYMDFQVLINHPEDSLADVLIVAAPRKLVDDYVELCKLAGMRLTALETKPIAIGRAVAQEEKLEGLIITEIGSEVTRLSIWDGNQIRLSTAVSVGKNQIFESLGIFKNSKDEPKKLNKEDLAELKEAATPIIEGILSAIKYHQNRDYKPTPIKKLILCGSGANIINIDKFFKEETKIECISLSPKLNGGALGPEYMTAFGLALRDE